MTVRAIGPFNGVLPEATGQVTGFMRDPATFPYLNYTQLIGAPSGGNGLYRYFRLDQDMPAQLANLDEYAWAFDDDPPEGKDFLPRGDWDVGQTKRYSFAYKLGDRTVAGWEAGAGINPRQLYDRIRVGHAQLHRASRVVNAIRTATYPAANTGSLNALFGSPTPAMYFDLSSGDERLPSGNPNPNFQIIKRTQNAVLRRIDLLTNGALRGEELIMVMGPKVAQAVSVSGEIVNFLKQSPSAPELMKRNKKWGLPDEYNGWQLVVEDTARVYTRQKADGTVADVTQPNQRDYIWNDDSIFFGSRVGGLDGGYGFQNFSSVQLYYFNGIVQVSAFSDAEKQLTRGRIDIEDDIKLPVPYGTFYLTGTLSPDYQPVY